MASELRASKNEIGVLQAKKYINSILIDMRMGKYNSYGHQTPRGYESTNTLVSATSATQEFEDDEELLLQIKSESDFETNTE